MLDYLAALPPVTQALLATLFTWFMTAAGAAGVFFFREYSHKAMSFTLGIASGVMIAASFWSLLAPAIDMAEEGPLPAWVPAAVGFLMGGIFLFIVDKLLPHLHPTLGNDQPEGIKTNWQRSILMVLAITLHNFPEGLAVGVAFGGVAAGIPSATLAGALALAIGIGIQNLPEGMAVSMPLRAEGMSTTKSFLYGQFSGMVEPIAGVIGALLVVVMRPVLPYALSFAAGAMIYVVVEELIPEAQRGEHAQSELATAGAMLGFAIMMILDVALG